MNSPGQLVNGAPDTRTRDAEAFLCAQPFVEDCVVLARRDENGIERSVAYFVAAGRVDVESLREIVAGQIAGFVLDAVVPVAAIPRTEDGAVDEARLRHVPIIDSALARAWEERISHAPGVRGVVVTPEPHRPPLPALHIADLLPNWQRGRSARHESPVASIDSPEHEKPATTRSSISEGPALSMPIDSPRTLPDALLRAAVNQPSAGVTYVIDQRQDDHQTYAALLEDAARILTGLRAAGLRPGDRVLLQLADARDFLQTFWACALGGVVPVPIAVAPSYIQANATLAKIRDAWTLLGHPRVVTSANLFSSLDSLGTAWDIAGWEVLKVDELRAHDAAATWHSSHPDDLALLLLTSGSTGLPKAVMQSHRAILARSQGSCEHNAFTAADVSLNWFPLDHVGGLLMFHVRDVFAQCAQVQVPTHHVLESPLRWLDLIEKHRATITWAPNFAFGLVNARADELSQRRWNLSSMRFILNGGEAIVAKTARRFLELLAAHDLPGTAMRPAWGMSETCSAVTYSHAFTLATTADADPFVEVGPPLPGIAIRIVDDGNQLLPENAIGRLQIQGPSVTTGYFGHPDANRDAFTPDGWFITGDLGFLRDGRLTVTGREKDVIIVNGINYYCQEIERLVEEVPGVAVSYTAACAVRVADAETDELAIVLHPTVAEPRALAHVLDDVRRKIVNEVGLNPAYLVPAARSAIPKTEIGKIQRARLRQEVEAGHFDAEIRHADVLLHTSETVPDWFVRPIWRCQQARRSHRLEGATIVFGSATDVGRALVTALGAAGHEVVEVREARQFARESPHTYELEPDAPDSYARLLTSCRADGIRVQQVVHAWTTGAHAGGAPRIESIADAARSGASLVCLARALSQLDAGTSVRVIVAGTHTQQVNVDDTLACERVPLITLAQSLGAEQAAVQCVHVDVPADNPAGSAQLIMRELAADAGDAEVAYRDGRRLVKRLTQVDLRSAAPNFPAFDRDGFYIITGGLGGVGGVLAADVLATDRARLLLVGRTRIEDRQHAAQTFSSLQDLARLGGALRYEAVDLSNVASVRAAVDAAASLWGQPLKGIVHLAGTYHDCAVADETPNTMADVWAAKVLGTCVLHEIVAENPDAWFVGFSSAVSYFGGAMVGAYAAANRFVEAAAAVQRQLGRRSVTIAWSMWDQTGMSRGHAGASALRARGFCDIAPAQGLRSMRALLARAADHTIVGIDCGHRFVRRHLSDAPLEVEQLTAFVATGDPGAVEASLHAEALTDRWGTPTTCDVVRLAALPRHADGTVDRTRLRQRERSAREAPTTACEQQVAAIWQAVLGGSSPARDDHFFDLGGHSVLATQVLGRVNAELGVDLPLRAIFEAPTVRALAQRIDEEIALDIARPDAIVPAPRDQPLPLSFAQQRMWFIDQLEPGSSSYSIPCAFRLQGALDLAALENALSAIVERHEALRSRFPAVDGEPVQIIDPPTAFRLRLNDVSTLAADERSAAAQVLARNEVREPFDLAQGPLLRATLIRLDAEAWWLLVTMHHIISDGWSLGVFHGELSAFYGGIAAAQPPMLPPLAIQSADYGAWQRRQLTEERLAAELAHWTRQLADVPTLLTLPTDRPRPAVQTSRGAHRTFRVSADLLQGLTALGSLEDATLFMTVLTAFESLLWRYADQDEFIVSTAVANRDRVETEPLIGCLINVVLLRADFSGSPTFREMLRRVRDVALTAFAHQGLPFEKLVEALQPERDLGYNPLTQVMFVFLPGPPADLSLANLKVESLDVQDVATPYDLQLHVWPIAGQLEGVLHFSTDLFDDATIDRLLDHFKTLIGSAVADPDRPVRSLALLGAAERRRLVSDWNATERAYPAATPLHQLVDDQATRTPDAVAVVYQGVSLTYRELQQRSNQLARRLRREGIGPDVLVGVCLDRSVDLVVGLLGILEAGGAYVPLDPAFPSERLRFMLQDSRAPVIVTETRLLESLPVEGITAVCIDGDGEDIAREPSDPLSVEVAPDDLAYVIYTSGSTGTPKGVEIPHRAVVNFLCSMRETPGITAEDRLLAVTTLSFDIAGLEIFLPLITGARLVLATREAAVDPFDLMRTLTTEQITMMQATPATWQSLIQAGWTGDPALTVLVGGEAVPRTLADDLIERAGNVWNMYGPTETTIWSTVHRLTRGPSIASIGRPIANTTTFVLDDAMHPVPLGIPGELFIGGDGLARGYRNRPDLTAEKFVRNPFAKEEGSRLYRTGDRVRYWPDGTLEFFGRLDNQVKVHGHRIELGEVEASLLRVTGVHEAVVALREDTRGDKRLVGYYTAGDPAPAVETLRRALKDQLPAYMVPALCIRLEALPRTLNGKIDRKKLPAPDGARLDLAEAFVPPRNELEEELSEIWRSVCVVRRIGVHDDFFALGGHSLLATQVLARVNARWHVQLPLRALFESPTVAGLAARIAAADVDTVPSLVPVPRTGRLPLSFAQQRLWFMDQLQPGSSFSNLPMAFSIRGALDVDALERSLAAVVARHESLRTRFPAVEGQPAQVIDRPGGVTLHQVDLSELPKLTREAEAVRRANEEAQRPFDLAAGPLFRALLIRLDTDHHVFLATMHHIVSDGWSLEMFTTDLGVVYDALVARQPSPLRPLPVQYADFTVWQRNVMTGDRLQTEVAYWKDHLAGLPTLVTLPADRPRPPVQNFAGRQRRFRIPIELTEAIKQLTRREGVTPFMTLMAAFQVLLHRYSGQEQFIVSTGIANRTTPEVEPLIGCLINVLLLKADLVGNPTFTDALRRTRTEALAAFAHQDVPFEKLVEELQPERDLSYNPLTQVMFVFLKAPMDRLTLSGADVTPVDLDSIASPYDISLHIWDDPRGYQGFWHFNSAIFDEATIERMSGHLVQLLREITAAPDVRVLDAPILTESERQRMLFEWNDTVHPFPDDTCLHQLFEKQVDRDAAAPAVLFGDDAITYGELEARSNRLAHCLRRKGVGPDVLVGLCVERSIDLVVGVLGILKSGGAYVPVDPAYPDDRIRMMLDDSQTPVLLTQRRLISTLPTIEGEVIAIDDSLASFDNEPSTRPESGVTCRHLCYVIYTSGSTGTPKGIALEHRGVVNNIYDLNARHGVGPGDRVMALSSLSFDMCVYEVLGTLEAGAAIVMPTPAQWREPAAWAELARRHTVTVWNSAPALLKMFVDYVERHAEFQPLALHLAILGGDWVPVSLPDRVKAIAPAIRVIVLGGATEASIHSIIFPVEQVDPSWKSIPYGVPQWNQKAYILNSSLQPSPIGVPGELFLGGIGLGRGYFQRAEQTSERFLPSPFVAGERIYRTGDLAQYRADGVIELLGRIDYQVKLRGMRIECGEIEATFRKHPAVRDVVVVAKDCPGGDKRLNAYVRPNDATAGPLARLLELEKQGRLKDLHTRELPNGLVVVCRNTAETDFGYTEIFEADDVSKTGITLGADACVFDVGANIGMFALKIWSQCPSARVFSFEPVQPVFELLDMNAALYGVGGRRLNVGLAAKAGAESLTYYPHLSLISSGFADRARDTETVKQYVLHQQHIDDDTLSVVLADRLESRSVMCEMRTVSQVMRDEHVDRIDLLKIDTERGELDVLAGIEDDDWPKIHQLIVEVFNEGDRVARVIDLLAGHGFETTAAQHGALSDEQFVNVTARRRGLAAPASTRQPAAFPWASRERLAEELREFAKSKLPDYMVPSGVVLLPELPLSPNGKVDRKALTSLERQDASDRTVAVPLDGPVQEALAAIFRDVLGRSAIGAADNFFDVGGHSLLAAQVIARISATFAVDLPLRAMFESPTVAGLAATVQQAQPTGGDRQLTPIERASRQGELPLSFAQEALRFVHELVPESAAYNIAPAIRIMGALDVPALELAISDLIVRHEVLRTTFVMGDEHPMQVIAAPAATPVPLDDLRHLPAAERATHATRIADAEARCAFDLVTGPLVRARLLVLGDTDHLLTLTFHHLVIDGWSLDLVARDLGELYGAHVRGTKPDLPALPVQFADFAAWERAWLGEHRHELAEYWAGVLCGAAPFIELPADRQRPPVQTLRGARCAFEWAEAISRRLDELGRSSAASPFMILLAAFDVFVSLHAETDDVIVGSPFANRVHRETQDLIGPFVNTLPLRLNVSHRDTFRSLIGRAREAVLAAETHQSLPFDQLVQAIKPPRDLSRNPVFQLNFRVLPAAPFPLALDGLASGLQVSASITSKFDLAIELFPASNGVRGFFEYSTDLFDETTIRKWSGQLERLSAALLSEPDRTIADVQVVKDLAAARAVKPLGPTNVAVRNTRRQGVRVGEERA